jgi:hypothetical protein
MQEVSVRLRFNRACLGASKRNVNGTIIFCMDRDTSGRVLFLPSRWLVLMQYASRLANRHQELVRQIDWDPRVDGTPKNDWRRKALSERRRPYRVLHEAFVPGYTIGVGAVLPNGMTIDDFRMLLEIVGTYRGYSPFNLESERYGTFDVISVERRLRQWAAAPEILEKSEPPGA